MKNDSKKMQLCTITHSTCPQYCLGEVITIEKEGSNAVHLIDSLSARYRCTVIQLVLDTGDFGVIGGRMCRHGSWALRG